MSGAAGASIFSYSSLAAADLWGALREWAFYWPARRREPTQEGPIAYFHPAARPENACISALAVATMIPSSPPGFTIHRKGGQSCGLKNW